MFANGWMRFCGWLAAFTVAVSLVACASTPKLVPHAFSFNGLNDKWAESVDLLAYAYGDSDSMVRNDIDNPRSSVYANKSTLPPGTGVNGAMPVGDFLFVKWRIKASGEVLEKRVELGDRLPKDMTDHELTFVIDGKQLYVYVITPTSQKPWGKDPVNRSWRSAFRVTYEIYPTLEKP
jgi:hypothetical protein